MSWPRIRSTQLAAGYASAAGTFRVCKLGVSSSVILKSVYLTQTGQTQCKGSVYVTSGVSVTVLFVFDLAANAIARWDGWAVLNDNDEIRVTTDAAQPSWVISGTLLQGTLDQSQVPMGAQQLPAVPDSMGALE